MRVFRLIPIFMLFLLLSSHTMFAAGKAYAWCCMCGTCRSGCDCAGINNCWCGTSTLLGSQSNRASDDLRELTRVGMRVRNNFNLNVLTNNIEDSLKFACPASGKTIFKDGTLDFQMVSKAEK
jgi:hypothetical protein